MDLRKYFDHLLLSAIIGASGLTVSYISKMSENIQSMRTSIELMADKFSTTDQMVKDHEIRLRQLERKHK